MKNVRIEHRSNKNGEQGFSLVELIIVVLIISILSVLSLLAFRGEQKFLADSQAYRILDVFAEAKQRAITQHETMRVEINKTRNTVRLISENAAGDASDDKEVRTLQLENPTYVNIETAPTNVAGVPIDSAPIPAITFVKSLHPSSLNDDVATLRFIRNGNVLNAGNNAVGNNAVMTGATIFVWMPNYSDSGAPLGTGSVIRAVTLMGSTGTTKYWKCSAGESGCTEWRQ